MHTDLIHDRGRGPEIAGTRITVYNLLTDFLDPAVTEAALCQQYELTPEQVAAARAYVLNNADVVLARHLEIEARIAAGNPPAVAERARQTRKTLLNFKEWLARRELEREQARADDEAQNGKRVMPTFREWVAMQKQSETGS